MKIFPCGRWRALPDHYRAVQQNLTQKDVILPSFRWYSITYPQQVIIIIFPPSLLVIWTFLRHDCTICDNYSIANDPLGPAGGSGRLHDGGPGGPADDGHGRLLLTPTAEGISFSNFWVNIKSLHVWLHYIELVGVNPCLLLSQHLQLSDNLTQWLSEHNYFLFEAPKQIAE